MSEHSTSGRLSVLDGVAVGVGSVIGVGIFRTTGEVLRASPSRAFAIAVWVFVGLLSLAGARAFGRVAARIPEAGGPYAYVRDAFGPRVGFVDGWFNAAVAIPARQAAQMAIVGEVLAVVTGGGARALGLAALAVLYVFHLAGVRAGADLQKLLSATKILLLAAAIGVAVVLGRLAEPEGTPALPPLPLSVGRASAPSDSSHCVVCHLALALPARTYPR